MNRPNRISIAAVAFAAMAGTFLMAYTPASAAPKNAAALPDGTFTLVCTVVDGIVTECKPPAVTPSPSPTVTATATPTATPSPTTSTPAPTPTPTPTSTPTPPTTGYPTAATTGVPSSVVLSAYTGPCTITVANTVIEAKIVNCSLRVRAANVTIRNSLVNGSIDNGSANNPQWNFTVANADVIAPMNTTAIGESNFRVTGSDIRGGNRGVNCYQNCWIEGNYIHGNRISGGTHASGVRMGMETTIWGNTIACDVANTANQGGCSADLTGYPDFSPVRDNLITKNRFLPTKGYFCAYGGWEADKEFNSHPDNATNIRYIDNEFVRGPSGRCGAPADGWVITSVNPNRPGWFWSANHWDNGVSVDWRKP